MNYESDESLAQLHDEMDRMYEERGATSSLSKMTDTTKLFFGIFLGTVILMLMNGKMETKTGFLMIGIAIFIMFMLNTQSQEFKELSNIECMFRINDQLKFLQDHPIGDVPQVPKGDVNVGLVGRKQWYEGRSFKRSSRVELTDDELGITEIYFCEVDIYTGDIITFKFAPEGVYGDETKDIKLLPPRDMRIERKRDQYMGLSKSK